MRIMRLISCCGESDVQLSLPLAKPGKCLQIWHSYPPSVGDCGVLPLSLSIILWLGASAGASLLACGFLALMLPFASRKSSLHPSTSYIAARIVLSHRRLVMSVNGEFYSVLWQSLSVVFSSFSASTLIPFSPRADSVCLLLILLCIFIVISTCYYRSFSFFAVILSFGLCLTRASSTFAQPSSFCSHLSLAHKHIPTYKHLSLVHSLPVSAPCMLLKRHAAFSFCYRLLYSCSR